MYKVWLVLMIKDKKQILSEIEVIFQKLFDDNKLKLKMKTKSKDIKGWDSLAHVNIILSIEKLFKFRFDPKDMYGFKNIEDLVNSIFYKINEK